MGFAALNPSYEEGDISVSPQCPRAEAIIAVEAGDGAIPPDGVAGRVLALQHELRRNEMRLAAELDRDRAVGVDGVVAEERMPVALVATPFAFGIVLLLEPGLHL